MEPLASGRLSRAFDHGYRSLRELIERIAAGTDLTRALVVVLVGAALAVAVAGLGFTVLVDDVMERNGVTGADGAVQRFMVGHRTAWLSDGFRTITWLGSTAVVVPLVAVAVVVLLRRREHFLALGLVVATLGTALLVQITKSLVDRPRPPVSQRLVAAPGWAFPSGHSAQAIACYGALAWVLTRSVTSRRARIATWTAALGVALLVGFSRVYLGVHWASDVVSGELVGVAWLALTIAIVELTRGLRARAALRTGA